MMFVNIILSVCNVYVVGYCGLSQSGLCDVCCCVVYITLVGVSVFSVYGLSC